MNFAVVHRCAKAEKEEYTAAFQSVGLLPWTMALSFDSSDSSQEKVEGNCRCVASPYSAWEWSQDGQHNGLFPKMASIDLWYPSRSCLRLIDWIGSTRQDGPLRSGELFDAFFNSVYKADPELKFDCVRVHAALALTIFLKNIWLLYQHETMIQ